MTTSQAVPSQFTENALRLLCKRYAHRGDAHPECPRCGVRHEDENQLIERISLGKQEYVDHLFRPLRFLPNSPTIFNLPCRVCGQTEPAGTLSACFKFDVEDSMTGIMDVARKGAMVLKYGGGVGYYVGSLRAKGEPIKTTHGKACGPVAVLRHYHSVAVMVTQAGRRDAAQMAILDDDHPDVREFIHMKDDDPQGLYSFNISVAASDDFMNDVEKGGVDSAALFDEICESAWRTGDPGFYFKDAAERANPTPWLGRLTGTNPCGEVPLLDNEPCNLGSINLGAFVSGKDIDWDALRDVSHLATSYLDDILDLNSFPDPAIRDAALATRKLGLGVMGWADMLALLNVPYSSQEAVNLGQDLMSKINEWAHDESTKLAQEKGDAPCFLVGENRNPIRQRNATLTCIAPTGSISMLAGCSSGIEPHFALEWTHEMGDGEKTQHRVAVAERLNGFAPETANEVGVDWHLAHQAAFQRHTDLAVSKTVNLPQSATVDDIKHAYLSAWQQGCKGVTVFRDGCRAGGEQVLRDAKKNGKFTSPTPREMISRTIADLDEYERREMSYSGTVPKEGDLPLNSAVMDAIHSSPQRRKLNRDRTSRTHRFQIGGQEGYVTVGLFEDGRPGEVFITASKSGSTVRGLLDAVGVLTSLSLQYGVPLEALVRKFRGTQFEPSGLTDNPDVRTASSVLDYLFSWLGREFGGEQEAGPVGNGCPECGGLLTHQEGCEVCRTCGYSRC